MKRLWLFLLTSGCMLAFLTKGICQQRYEVSYHFALDSIILTGPQTFANKITIHNSSPEEVHLRPSSEGTAALNGLIRLPELISLAAGETKTYPLKYIADRQTIVSENQHFALSLSSQDPKLSIQPSQTFYVKLQTARAILLEPGQSEYYIDPATGQLQFLLRVVNTSLIAQTIQPMFSGFPAGFELQGELLPITLPAGGQSLLSYTARTAAANISTDFDLRIQALNPSGEVLSSTFLRIMSTTSVKRLGSSDAYQSLPLRNSLALRYINMGSYSSIYQMQGQGGIDIHPEVTLDYRMTLDYYQKQKGINLYDAHLDYQTKKWGVKVGNIYENLDQSVNGRGMKASYKFDSEKTLSIYAIDNKYMLYSEMFDYMDAGETFGARYTVGRPENERASITYLHRNDNFRGVKSELFNTAKKIRLGALQDLALEGGYSHERTSYNDSKHAFALGASYNYTKGNYQLSSINYYSSPYYSGLRRGLLQSDTRISKLRNNNDRLSARVSYMDSKPAYQNGFPTFLFNNANRIQIFELGYLLASSPLQIEFKPYFMGQRATYYPGYTTSLSPTLARSSSSRLATNVTFFAKDHRLSMLADYGFTTLQRTNEENTNYHSVKINGSYTYKRYGFNTFIQLKPYYLSDLYSAINPSSYSMYTLSPNVRFEAFAGRLQTQAAATYSYYGFSSSNNFSLNADLAWRLKNNWNLTAQIYYTAMRGDLHFQQQGGPWLNENPIPRYAFDNRQIRVGIEKQFGRKGATRGHKLQLSLYEDANNNQQRDPQENFASSVLVKMNNQAAVTDNKGQVKFLDVPQGNYRIAIENNQGWVSREPIDLVVTKNKALEVPLIRTNIVKGKITAAVNKYVKGSTNLGGIRIVATNANNSKYQTLSDAQGNYTFFLPSGTYTLSVSSQGMAFSIENPTLTINVDEQNDLQVPDFIYKNETRKVDVKRF